MHYGINFHRNLAKFHPAISTQSNNPIHPIITSTYCITVLHLSIEEAFIEPSTYHDWFKSVLCSYKLLKSLSTLHTRKAVFVKRLKHILLCFKISWKHVVLQNKLDNNGYIFSSSCQLESKKQGNVQRLNPSCHQVIFLSSTWYLARELEWQQCDRRPAFLETTIHPRSSSSTCFPFRLKPFHQKLTNSNAQSPY